MVETSLTHNRHSLRRRVTTSKILSNHYRTPSYAPMGALRWFEMPDAAVTARKALEQQLYDHYVPWGNFTDDDRIAQTKEGGFTVATWRAPKPWHGAHTDHPGDCQIWARIVEMLPGADRPATAEGSYP